MINIPDEIKEPIYVKQVWIPNNSATYYKILYKEVRPFRKGTIECISASDKHITKSTTDLDWFEDSEFSKNYEIAKEEYQNAVKQLIDLFL